MGKLWSPQGGWRGWHVWVCRAMGAGVLLLASCGGGADSPSGGGGSQAGVGSGGTGAYSNGPITGFGSIVVNGVHYDHTSAVSIKKTGDDATLHSPDDLKLGMMVEVDVAPVGDGGKLNIRYGSDLLGPVDSIDSGAQTLTVMGQVVTTFYVSEGNKTQFGDGLSHGLADLSAGDMVEVYGFEDAGTGMYIATRIERKQAYTGAYVVRGAIENLEKDADGNVTGCTIGGQHVAYTWLPGSQLVEGLVARAELMRVRADPSGPWLAMKMALSAPITTADRGVALIDGLVTRIEPGSTTRFSVNGVDVDASLADCPLCRTLTVGQRLSVKGARVNGVIVAAEIK